MATDFVAIPPALRRPASPARTGPRPTTRGNPKLLASSTTATTTSAARPLTGATTPSGTGDDYLAATSSSPSRTRRFLTATSNGATDNNKNNNNFSNTLQQPLVDKQGLPLAAPAAVTGLVVQPPSIQFAGFTLDQPCTAQIRVRNATSIVQRVYVHPPADAVHFRTVIDNAGKLAPGMAQEFTIVFLPEEYREYNTEVRIVADSGEVALPVIAFPQPTAMRFPRRVDFGRCELARPYRRIVHLDTGSTVADQDVVELAIQITKADPDFTVEPTHVLLPSNGSCDVAITFTPTRLATVSAELLVMSSALHAEPQRVQLVGSCHPGSVKQAELLRRTATTTTTAVFHDDADEAAGGEEDVAVLEPNSTANRRSRRTSRWTRLDPGTLLFDEKLERYKAAQEAKLVDVLRERARDAHGASDAALPGAGDVGRAQKLAAGFTVVGGLRIPARLTHPTDVNFVLTQQPGKLKPRDLAVAIATKRAQEAALEAAQARLRALEEDAEEEDEYEPPRAASADGRDGRDGVDFDFEQQQQRTTRATSASGRIARAKRGRKGAGPGLSLHALTAAELSGSWLFPALSAPSRQAVQQGHHQLQHNHQSQGLLGATGLPPGVDVNTIVSALSSTPDHQYLHTGTGLDELLGALQVQRTQAGASSLSHDDLTVPPIATGGAATVGTSLIEPRKLREMVFISEVSAIDAAERAREFQRQAWSGETLLPRRATESLMVVRENVRRAEALVRQRIDRLRRTAVAVPTADSGSVTSSAVAAAAAAVTNVDGGSSSTLTAANANATASASGGGGAQLVLSNPVLRAGCLPGGKVVVSAGERAVAPPSFDEALAGGNSWDLRRDTLARLRSVLTAHIVRERVAHRLDLLMGKLASTGVDPDTIMAATVFQASAGEDVLAATRASVAEAVTREHRRAQMEAHENWVILPPVRPGATDALSLEADAFRARGLPTRFAFTAARITRNVFPIAGAEDANDRSGAATSAEVAAGTPGARWDLRVPVPAAIPVYFSDVAPFELPEPCDDELMGYTPLPVPLAPTYAPRELERPLREGALHETAATGALPLPSAQVMLDPRLTSAAASRKIALPTAGLPSAIQPISWAEAFLPHPTQRPVPAGVTRDSATGAPAGGSTLTPLESDPDYLLHPSMAATDPFSLAQPPMPTWLTGVSGGGGGGGGVSGVGRVGAAASGDLRPSNSGASVVAGGGMGRPSSSHTLGSPVVVASGSVLGIGIGGADNIAQGPSHSSPLDINGLLPTLGQVLSAQPGFSSLRALQAPPGGGDSTGSVQPLWFAQQFVPTLQAPVPDITLPLMREVPPPALDARTGLPRLLTDVTPTEQRVYVFDSTVSASGDPWIAAGLPALLHGPRDEDVQSDDSESDPDDHDDAGDGAGDGASSPGGTSPQRKRRVPTLQQAAMLFAPKSLRAATTATATSSLRGKTAALQAPRDAALLAGATYAQQAAMAHSTAIASVLVGTTVLSAPPVQTVGASPDGGVNGGIADPRRSLVLHPV